MKNLSSSPLRLRERLREKLEARLEAVPLVNVLLIAVLLVLVGSRFVYAPGLTVDLDAERAAAELSSGAPKTQLPIIRTVLPGVETSAVLTVKSDKMFIFEGHIYEDLEEIFSEKNPYAPPPEARGVLLVKLDRSVSIQGLFNIAELAGKAGFSSLQIAGESPSYRSAEVR